MADDTKLPNWARTAARVDRPEIAAWYKPEDGALDGTLIWRGQQENRTSGETFNAYAIRLTDTGKVLGVSERAGLRELRLVRVGSPVFIQPTEVKVLPNGREMQMFEIRAEYLEPMSEPVRGNGNRGGGTPPDGPGGASEKVPF